MQLAFAAVGSMIGGQVLGTGIVALGMNGAMIGWTAGSLIGSFFGPKQRSYGPRLTDKRVQGSSYGSCIPWVSGAPRLAGEVIWASEIREIAHTEEQGKGGGGASYTSYTYEVDLLVRLTENVVPGMDKVWKYGDLVYNISAEADPATVTASENTDKWSRITYYSGAADQMPDPDYEAAVGPGNAPATRGGASVFIKDLQLGQTNAVPSLTFRLVETAATLEATAEVILGSGTSPQVVVLSEQYALAIFSNGSSGMRGSLFDISGAAPVLVTNTSLTAVTTTIGPLERISDTQALLFFWPSGDARASACVVGHIGTTVLMGAATMFPAGTEIIGDDSIVSLHALDATRFLSAYKKTSYTLAAFVTTVSGWSISGIGALNVSGSYADPMSTTVIGAVLSAASAVVAFESGIGTNDLRVIALAISGDTVTFGAQSDGIDGPDASQLAVTKITDSSALVAYRSAYTTTRCVVVSTAGGGAPVQATTSGAIATMRMAPDGAVFAGVFVAADSSLQALRLSAGGQPVTDVLAISGAGSGLPDVYPARSGNKAVIVYSRSGVLYGRILTGN